MRSALLVPGSTASSQSRLLCFLLVCPGGCISAGFRCCERSRGISAGVPLLASLVVLRVPRPVGCRPCRLRVVVDLGHLLAWDHAPALQPGRGQVSAAREEGVLPLYVSRH